MRAYDASAQEPRAPGATAPDSARVAAARMRAAERLRRQRGTLRPIGVALIVLVVVSTVAGHPHPALGGRGLAVTLGLGLFVIALAFTLPTRFPERGLGVQITAIAALGVSGIVLAAAQPKGASEVAGSVAVFMAVIRLPTREGLALAGLITGGLALATALAGSSTSSVVATMLLCALLALVGRQMKQWRLSQDRTELLLAQLEDAQEDQARAAAAAERARIAGELHDVLAHSLSGAAIQLQGARMLAEREQADPRVRAAIGRASDLVKEGLASARQAVGALRGEELPSIAQLAALTEGFRIDMNVDVILTVEGTERRLPADASLALYRGAQEALTNVARYAPRASTTVTLRYEPGRTTLSVENAAPPDATAAAGLRGVGGGRGLAGMRERIEQVGGRAHAGPSGSGWRVELEVPA